MRAKQTQLMTIVERNDCGKIRTAYMAHEVLVLVMFFVVWLTYLDPEQRDHQQIFLKVPVRDTTVHSEL